MYIRVVRQLLEKRHVADKYGRGSCRWFMTGSGQRLRELVTTKQDCDLPSLYYVYKLNVPCLHLPNIEY
ncbi:hypothetical protein OWV82_017199 [Melia azedarach]|uniref:Uncharacterized protein n=1 Tax=Melia azedarach TaxID=155640 RepID=A0ACC1XI64_MELAZ|nr:hypothetical protein OWV82_017199 [Melia azedarach]